MDSNLHVAVATDELYTMYTGIMLYSLFDNNRDFDSITVHVLDNGMTYDGKTKLNDIADSFGRYVCYYDCSKIGDWLGSDVISIFKTSDTNVSITAYARLFLPEIIDRNIEKILYLDADGIVLRSYKRLWKMEIERYTVLGVIDNVDEKAKKYIGLDNNYGYINSGVLLMNLKRLRERDFISEMKRYIYKYNGHVYHHDQGIINGVLNDSIGYLTPEYNMMSFMYEYKKASSIQRRYGISNYYTDEQMNFAKRAPVFIHFTEGNMQRPWIKNCRNPMRSVWRSYRDKTVWKNTPCAKDNRNVRLRIIQFMNRNLPAGILQSLFR